MKKLKILPVEAIVRGYISGANTSSSPIDVSLVE